MKGSKTYLQQHIDAMTKLKDQQKKMLTYMPDTLICDELN